MKRYIQYIGCVIVLFVLSSCDNLDMEPQSSITDANYWKTEAHFKAFNTGLHALLRNYSYNYFILGEPRANLYCEEDSFSGEAPQGAEIYPHNTMNKQNPGVRKFADLYLPINQVSLMIDRTEVTNLLSESVRNYYLGQAYGMRAWYYFHLLRSWGDVVIHTKGTDGADLDIYNLAKAASPATEVLAQIKADIEASEKAFGSDISFSQGRHYWSLPATLMLKGEVYLWSGRQMGGGNPDYQIAKQALEKIKMADVMLLDDFESVFAFDNKKNKEIIFTIHNGQNEFYLWEDNYRQTMIPSDLYMLNYYREDGTSYEEEPADEKIRGSIRFALNKDYYFKGYQDDDSRKRVTLKGVYRKENNDELNFIGHFANKFKGTLLEGGTFRTMLDDYPVYRFADCLLQLAMAKVFLNEDPSEEINLIRERAYGKDYFAANRTRLAYPNDVDGSFYTDNKYGAPDTDPIEAVLKERLREFMFEGKRWYDLRLVGAPYIFKYSHADEKRLLWPIDETTLTNNTLLEQTSGY